MLAGARADDRRRAIKVTASAGETPLTKRLTESDWDESELNAARSRWRRRRRTDPSSFTSVPDMSTAASPASASSKVSGAQRRTSPSGMGVSMDARPDGCVDFRTSWAMLSGTSPPGRRVYHCWNVDSVMKSAKKGNPTRVIAKHPRLKDCRNRGSDKETSIRRHRPLRSGRFALLASVTDAFMPALESRVSFTSLPVAAGEHRWSCRWGTLA